MKYSIMKIINEWDPIDLFPLAPQDEYDSEINKIIDILELNPRISVEYLAKEINNIFTQKFGDDVYLKDIDECKTIALEILNKKLISNEPEI